MFRKIQEVKVIKPKPEGIDDVYRDRKYISYDGFVFQGQAYSLGFAKLNEEGMKLLRANFPWVTIWYHFLLPDGRTAYKIYARTKFINRYGWKLCWSYDFHPDLHLECVEGIVDEPKEVLMQLPQTAFDEVLKLTNIKMLQDGKNQSNATLPHFRDWEMPEVLVGWAVYYILGFGALIFKDWYITLSIQIGAFVIFNIWRWQKIHGYR